VADATRLAGNRTVMHVPSSIGRLSWKDELSDGPWAASILCDMSNEARQAGRDGYMLKSDHVRG